MGNSSLCPRCGGRTRQGAAGEPPVCPKCTPAPDPGAETRTSADAGPSTPAQDYRGRTFGNYTILEEISRGAMGVVYKARQHHLDRIVALKVLLAGELATEAQVARFRREAQAAARLRHPAIVPIHEVGVVDGKHFYTMDYIKGRDLSDLIRSGEISTRRALDVAAQVADALDYAHTKGIIHRDIKPSNIMVDGEGGIHIMDFGLAKQIDSDTKFTRTGTTIGTPAYMPPEQASGDTRRVDQRADIYSLGAVLYEMLTAQAPFSGDTMMNTLMKVLNDEPVPPKRLNPRIHRDIQTIVLKAMEKSPERRYPTMRAFATDVRHFIAGESITARPAGLLYRFWRFFRRNHSAVFATAAVIVIALTAAAVIVDMRRQGELRTRAAFETGKRKGAQDAERKLEQQEKPTSKVVLDENFSGQPLASRWVVEEKSPWRVTKEGQLEVAAGRLAAIHTKDQFTGNVTVTFEASVPPGRDGSPPSEAVIGCFLGDDWMHSCRFSFGGAQPRLLLLNRLQEVAETKCGPLAPDTWYRVTLKRDSVGLDIRVSTEADEPAFELSYKEIGLPRQLHRQFVAGLFTERTHMRVRRFTVEQEFPPAKLSPLKAAEGLFRDDNMDEARNQYEKIAQGYEGRYEGLAALLGIAACHEADRRYKESADLLRRIEDLAPKTHHADLPALLTEARLRRFSSSASLNNFADAVEALARVAASGGHIDEAWVWQFPRFVGQMLTNRAYDEALALLRARVFSPDHLTLYATVAALQATALDAYLVPRVRQLGEGFCSNGQFEKVRDTYDAYPTLELADAFARSAVHLVQRGQNDAAFALLAFCAKGKMKGGPLSQVAIDLGNKFCEAGAPTRVASLYEAFPEPKLAPVFTRAIQEATAAGRLEDAFALVSKSLEIFPGDARKLLGSSGPAIRLAKAFVARGDLLKPIALHSLFDPAPDDPSLVALFVEATRAAIAAKKTDEALRLLDHARVRFGVLHAELAAAATRLVALHTAAGQYDKAAAAYAAYPNEALAATVVKAIADATAAGQLHDALVLLGQYARRRNPIPADAVRALAERLAALEPNDEATAALVAEYRRAYELYDSPVARTTFTLALGDACVQAGRLGEAPPHYEASSDPEGLLRAGCLAVELGDADQAAAQWRKLRDLAQDNKGLAAVAAFMLGETPLDRFTSAAAGAGLPPSLTHYIAGLRLWTEEDDRAYDEFAQAASGPAAWFTPLARRTRVPRTPPENEEP